MHVVGCMVISFELDGLVQDSIEYSQATASMVKDFFERHPGANEANGYWTTWLWVKLQCRLRLYV